MIIKNLFEEAENIIAAECNSNRSEDFQRQYEIIRSRRWGRVTSEPDILNNLFVQAASYSVVRKYFKILYPEDIWLLDSHYDTNFFKAKLVPALTYDDWVNAVITCGNVLLKEEHFPQAQTLESVVSQLKEARGATWSSYEKKPRSRIVLSLATALPKVRKEVLKDPSAFLDKLDVLSKNHPGKAFDYATSFSKGIIEMGNPLVCNFLKELGLLYFVKVDVHVAGFMDNIAFCKTFSKKDAFIMSWLLAKEAGIEPFFLDKILYVGGKYTKPQLMRLFDRYKVQYVSAINSLTSRISEYH
jgi:hypothetical protein